MSAIYQVMQLTGVIETVVEYLEKQQVLTDEEETLLQQCKEAIEQ